MNILKGKSGSTYQLEQKPFSSGGEGEIYNVLDNKNIVAKIYKSEKRTKQRERKLSAMLSNRPTQTEQYAWPIDIVYENDNFVGFIMPKFSGMKKLRDVYVFDRRKGKPWNLYISIASSLCKEIDKIHNINQVVGDLNPENILVNTKTGEVCLVDTDSYHITDSKMTYRCLVGMPQFVAPELQGADLLSDPLPTFTKETDRFSLAVLVFCILMNGAHPFSCTILNGSSSRFQPIVNMKKGYCPYFKETAPENMTIPVTAPPITSLPEEIQKLFRRAFVDGLNNPKNRPTAKEWYYALENLNNNLKACDEEGHIYYNQNLKCPWCEVEKNLKSSNTTTFTPPTITKSIKPLPSNNMSSATKPQTTAHKAPLVMPNYRLGYSGRRIALFALGVIVIIAIIAAIIVGAVSCNRNLNSSSKSENSDNEYNDIVVDIPDDFYDNQTSAYDEDTTSSEISIQYADIDGDGIISPQEEYVAKLPNSYQKLFVKNIADLKTYIRPAKKERTYTTEKVEYKYISGTASSDNVTKHKIKIVNPGEYSIRIKEISADSYLYVFLRGSDGSKWADETIYKGKTFYLGDLEGNSTYTLEIYSDVDCKYKLEIGCARKVKEISQYTQVKSYVEFYGQTDRFQIIPKVDTEYVFYFKDIKGTNEAKIRIDRDKATITNDNFLVGEGACIILEAGRKYDINVYSTDGSKMSYTLGIGVLKESLDISSFTYINDYVSNIDDRVTYKFTAPSDGVYSMDISDCHTDLNVYVENKNNEIVCEDAIQNGSMSFILEKGETYTFEIVQASTIPSKFKLKIWRPKKTVNVSPQMSLIDSLEYENQKNCYELSSPNSSTVTINVSGIENDRRIYIVVYNELNERIMDTYCENGDQIELKYLSPIQSIKIYVSGKYIGKYVLDFV